LSFSRFTRRMGSLSCWPQLVTSSHLGVMESRLSLSGPKTVLTSLTLGIISRHRDYARFAFLSVGSHSQLISVQILGTVKKYLFI
jgi:hypothetical protein